MGAPDTLRAEGLWGRGQGPGLDQAVGWEGRQWEQAVGTLLGPEGQWRREIWERREVLPAAKQGEDPWEGRRVGGRALGQAPWQGQGIGGGVGGLAGVGAWAWGLQEGGNQSSGRHWSPRGQGSCSGPGWGTDRAGERAGLCSHPGNLLPWLGSGLGTGRDRRNSPCCPVCPTHTKGNCNLMRGGSGTHVCTNQA